MARDIVIGDIHGCFDELQLLLRRLEVTDEDRLISVGDLVDRGPRSPEVWDFFRTRPNSVVLMGNHERKHVRGVLSYSQEIVKLQLGERYEDFCAWAAELPYYLRTPQAIVVHGGFEDGVPLAEQREDVLAGTTSGARYLEKRYPDRYWPEMYSGEVPIVFGHHVVGDEVKSWNGRVHGLDTGACHGRFLSAMVLPGFEVVSVPAARDYWVEEQRRWQVPVLRSWPWHEFSRKKLERERAALRRREGEEVVAFAEALDAWLGRVEALVPPLLDRVRARRDALLPCFDDRSRRAEVAAQPCSSLLFACHAGSLDAGSISMHLSTPGAIIEAARAYGVDASDLRPPHAVGP